MTPDEFSQSKLETISYLDWRRQAEVEQILSGKVGITETTLSKVAPRRLFDTRSAIDGNYSAQGGGAVVRERSYLCIQSSTANTAVTALRSLKVVTERKSRNV